MGERGSDEWMREIHARLLGGDPTAPAELAETTVDKLVAGLRRTFPEVRDEAHLFDAAADALLSYIKSPQKFDPARRGLRGYLKMAAEGDLRNALARDRRRARWECAIEDVELASSAGNESAGTQGSGVSEGPDSRVSLAEVQARLDGRLFEGHDRELVELILAGERSTAAFARILGISALPVKDQRRAVKKHKDRIKKRLSRLGEKNRDLQG